MTDSLNEVDGTDTTSGGEPFASASGSTAPASLSSGATCSCECVSIPSTSVFDGGSPNEAVGDGVRRLSKITSDGKEEKEEGGDVGMTPVISRRRVVVLVASTSEGCGSSALKEESEGNVDVASAAAAGEETGGDVEGWSLNRVCTFRIRSSKIRPSREISMKKLEEPGRRNVP